MASPTVTHDIFLNNPYESHPSLTPLEAEVLWEYAKLAQHVKLVRQTRKHAKALYDLSDSPASSSLDDAKNAATPGRA